MMVNVPQHSTLNQNLTLTLAAEDKKEDNLVNQEKQTVQICIDLDGFRAGKCAWTPQVVCANEAHPCTFSVRINI